MSDEELRRRRRLTPSGPRRSSGGGGNSFLPWAVTIVAAIAVIVGGWFLGQTLARVFSGSQNSSSTQVAQQPQPTLVPVTPQPSPSEAAATAAPSPSPTPARTATPRPTLKPSPIPTVAATLAPTLAPTQAPTLPPTPAPTIAPVVQTRKTQPIARRKEITPAPALPAAPAQEDAASRTVRAYIDALRRGDPESAQAYLGNGVPDENFIDGNTRIVSITSTRNNDGSYKVEADMKTAQGEYYETFVVASTGNGNRILEKTAIKP